jgi:hypothetical protein
MRFYIKRPSNKPFTLQDLYEQEMKRKPAPRKLRNPKASRSLTLEHEGTKLHIYADGIMTIQGSTKQAAYALARQILEYKNNLNTFMITANDCVQIKCSKGEKYTIEWIGKGILQDDLMPKPFFWDEFKAEFERFCELKIFL